MSQALEIVLAVLVHIQANLDGDLGLAALSKKAGLSPFHFHRVFKAEVGETPKEYVARLRLERGAFRLQIHDSTLLQIALDCGFQNHETFTRAFQRAFGRSPSAHRAWSQKQVLQHDEPACACPLEGQEPFEISATKVVRLRTMHLAFLRHVGPYESVPDALFDDLEKWAVRQRVSGPRIWIGIGHDAPGTTPPERLRFDAALVVPRPFASEGRIGHQLLPGGEFAVTTHAGAFDSLPAAYAAIFSRVVALSDYELIGLPAVEIYRCANVNARLRVNETDIYLPVARRTLTNPGPTPHEIRKT